jgi:hypothetical protein
MSQRFQRTIEDFNCGNCGLRVLGNGYTNHCPVCLWSRHVDVHPGDRASACGGMMEPIGLTIRGIKQTINHRCVVCGHKRKNIASPKDNRDALIELSASPA